QQLTRPVLQEMPVRGGSKEMGQSTFNPNQLAARVTPLVEIVRVNQPKAVVLWAFDYRLNESFVVSHGASVNEGDKSNVASWLRGCERSASCPDRMESPAHQRSCQQLRRVSCPLPLGPVRSRKFSVRVVVLHPERQEGGVPRACLQILLP